MGREATIVEQVSALGIWGLVLLVTQWSENPSQVLGHGGVYISTPVKPCLTDTPGALYFPALHLAMCPRQSRLWWPEETPGTEAQMLAVGPDCTVTIRPSWWGLDSFYHTVKTASAVTETLCKQNVPRLSFKGLENCTYKHRHFIFVLS